MSGTTTTVENAAQAPAVPSLAGSRRKPIVRLILLLAVVVASIVIWRLFFNGPTVPPGVVALSGRIEGDDSAIAPKTSGRIVEIRFREGDKVQAGDVIATLSDDQIVAREEQARAAVAVAQATAKSANEQIAVLQEQLRQNQIQTGQAKLDAEGRVNQAQADLAAAESDLAQQHANYQLGAFDRDAYTRLAQTGAASERQAKQASAIANQQEAAIAAAQRRVTAATGALQMAKANLENPNVRQAQSAMIQRQIAEQRADLARSHAGIQQAQAQLAEAEANRKDLIVYAPFSGVIATRAAEPGEVVTAGTALVTLIDLQKVYLRGFVPEGQIGTVKLGQAAHVYLDSNPKKPIDAYVLRIDPEATFTPENTYFRDERVKQVVGLKLGLKSGFGYAKPGMPADGEILVQGEAWPTGRGSR